MEFLFDSIGSHLRELKDKDQMLLERLLMQYGGLDEIPEDQKPKLHDTLEKELCSLVSPCSELTADISEKVLFACLVHYVFRKSHNPDEQYDFFTYPCANGLKTDYHAELQDFQKRINALSPDQTELLNKALLLDDFQGLPENIKGILPRLKEIARELSQPKRKILEKAFHSAWLEGETDFMKTSIRSYLSSLDDNDQNSSAAFRADLAFLKENGLKIKNEKIDKILERILFACIRYHVFYFSDEPRGFFKSKHDAELQDLQQKCTTTEFQEQIRPRLEEIARELLPQNEAFETVLRSVISEGDI